MRINRRIILKFPKSRKNIEFGEKLGVKSKGLK